MQTRISGKTAKYHFESLAELGDYIDNTPAKWRGRSSVSEGRGYSWDLDAGYARAVGYAQNGWIEGAEKAQDALKTFAPKTPAPDTRTDVYGFRPHVPRFCAGAPDSMIRHATVADSGAGRVLTLLVPINAGSWSDAKDMSNFGLGVAQYVNQLETDGTRVELIAMQVSKVSGWRVAQTWVVKRAEQPLDLAVVAFAIGHPAMFRRLGFALLERCDAPECQVYGQSLNAMPSDLINASAGTIVLNGMKEARLHAKTPEDALKYITAEIEKAIQAQELDQ